jgi:tetratricopeptide (TPR) repeat protein
MEMVEFKKSKTKNQRQHSSFDFRWLFVFIFATFSTYSFAQIKFYASAPKSVPANQNFQLNFTIENGNGTNLKPPSVNDFQILGGPNTSSSMQWVNGNVTQSVTYSYILRPKKEGTFTIGKASVNVSGATMESNELSIQVTPPVAQQQTQQRQRGYDPFSDDPFFSQQQEPEQQFSKGDIEKQLKDEVFVKLSVTDNSVYKGEMLTATYKLYFTQNLSGFNITKAPSFDGFWSQEVELDPKRRPTIETINGKQYNTVDILKYNLYPQRAGSLQITAAEVSTVVQVQARSRSRNIFDDFFNMGRVQQIPMTLKTTGTNITAKELPESGKPENFSGAVGKYSFEAKLSSKQTKTDEPITYTVKVSGSGNLKMINGVSPKFPSDFEVYDPKVKENISNTAGGMNGSKQYDYLLIPRKPGEFNIESYSFSYFDPSAAKYFTIKSPEFTVNVTGEPSKNVNANTVSNAVSKDDVALIGEDIRYIKTNAPSFEKSSDSFFGSVGYWGLYSTPILLFVGLLVWKKRNEELAADVIGTKRKRALKLAKKRLSIAEKHLAKNDKKNFYDEVSRALWGYLGDKLSIDMSELSKDNVEEKLLARNASPEIVARLKNILGTCELALYAPVGDGGEMKTNYNNALNLIADLEDQIKVQTASTVGYTSLLAIAFIFFSSFSSSAQTAQELYQSASVLYKANSIDSAAAQYEMILAQGFKNAETYYNLGNCYYKLNNTGKAILNYERALKLSPNDEDIIHNLKIANLKVADKIVPVPQLAIVSGWQSFLKSNPSSRWGVYALVFCALSFICFAAMLFSSSKRFFFGTGAALLFLSFTLLFIASRQSGIEKNSQEGILITANAVAKNAPTANSTDAFMIHEGIKLQLLDNVAEWYKIRLADGKIGWLPVHTFEKI